MKSSASRQRRQQRLKCVVIPVLVAVLAAVLFWPAGDPATGPAATPVTASRANQGRPAASPTMPLATVDTPAVNARSATSVSQTSSTAAATATPAVPHWPDMPLHQITAVNPFVKKADVTPVQTSEPEVEPQVADPQAATAGPWLQLATGLAALAQGRSDGDGDEPGGALDPPADRSASTLPHAAQTGQAADAKAATAEEDSDRATAIDYATIGRLSAIVHGASGRHALLDGNRIVREGDEVPGGFQVVQITEREIWVRPLQP